MLKARPGREAIAAALAAKDASSVSDPGARAFRVFAEGRGNDLLALAAVQRAESALPNLELLAKLTLPILVADRREGHAGRQSREARAGAARRARRDRARRRSPVRGHAPAHEGDRARLPRAGRRGRAALARRALRAGAVGPGRDRAARSSATPRRSTRRTTRCSTACSRPTRSRTTSSARSATAPPTRRCARCSSASTRSSRSPRT